MPSGTTLCNASDATAVTDAPRVLLADDNRGMLTRATTVLKTRYSVVGAVNDGGVAALEAAQQLRPDVVVLDISMPGMCGLEVARRLRAAGSTAEIVFLTVHDDDEFVRAAQAAGGLGYVVKARLATDLVPAVAEAYAHRPFVSTGRAKA